MKYFSRLYVPLMIIVFTFSGCEDTFETTLEINPPEHTDRLVVHAYGSTNGEDLKVHLTQSSGLLESLQNNLISKATVTLWKDQVQLAELEEVSFGSNYRFNYILPEGTIVYEKGATYRLEVEADGFEKAIGTATVPEDIPLLKQKFEEDGTSLESGDFNSEVEIEFQDPANEENFYEVGVTIYIENNSNPYFNEIYTETYDPAAQQGISYSNLIVNDLSFDGNIKNFPLVIRKFKEEEEDVDNMFVLWRVTSEDHYLFNKSARKHYDQDGNPFASPVQVFSNIENGIGIFSIMNEEYVKVSL